MMSSLEIETIVREVLSRMMTEQNIATHPSQCTLHDAVISLDALRAVPATAKIVHIPPSAIVTPAARDWCRERSVVLERLSSMLAEGREPSGSMLAVGREPSGEAVSIATTLTTPDGWRRTATTPDGLRHTAGIGANAVTSETTPTRLFVAGTVEWLPGLARQLCPKQSRISERSPDDASAIRAIASALRAGHRSGIAIVQSPYSALWQSARDEMLRPAVVSQWSELNEIFREVPVNLLIIPATRWSVAGAANVARRFLDHLRSQS
jgi:hypothetical protein